MEKSIIEKNIQLLCEASLVIQNCMTDNQYLCDFLNKTDKNYIGQYYRSDKEGVVINIRKEVAKNILLSDITPDTLIEIITKHKSENQQKLKAWSNPYKIIHPFVNQSFSELDNFIINFSNQLKEIVGSVKTHIVNFDGAQYQGTEHYWLALYNEKHSSQSDGLQLFFSFYKGKFTYGIYHHVKQQYLIGPIDFVDVDGLFDFVNENKNLILEEEIRQKMTFVEAAKYVLEQNGNSPMTSVEIWNEISKLRLVATAGKTPQASLNSIVTAHSVNLEKVAPERQARKKFEIKNSIFKIVSTEPYKFILNNYMPPHIKENLTQNGFITIEMLAEIFKKNGLNFEI